MTIASVVRRHSWLALVVTAVVALVILVAFALRPTTVRAFALGVPDAGQVAVVRPGTHVCEGPIVAPSAFKEVGIWGGVAAGAARMTAVVRDARTSRVLGRAAIVAGPTGEYRAVLPTSVSGGTPLRICLAGRRGTFSLLGTAAVDRGAAMTGPAPGLQFSLVLLRPGQTLLQSLPTAFARASLFKLSWIGSWTFWLLAGALLMTIPLGAVAITLAARDDERPSDQASGSSVDQPDRR